MAADLSSISSILDQAARDQVCSCLPIPLQQREGAQDVRLCHWSSFGPSAWSHHSQFGAIIPEQPEHNVWRMASLVWICPFIHMLRVPSPGVPIYESGAGGNHWSFPQWYHAGRVAWCLLYYHIGTRWKLRGSPRLSWTWFLLCLLLMLLSCNSGHPILWVSYIEFISRCAYACEQTCKGLCS